MAQTIWIQWQTKTNKAQSHMLYNIRTKKKNPLWLQYNTRPTNKTITKKNKWNVIYILIQYNIKPIHEKDMIAKGQYEYNAMWKENKRH